MSRRKTSYGVATCALFTLSLLVSCAPLEHRPEPVPLAQQPAVWGGRSLLGNPQRGNLNSVLEIVEEAPAPQAAGPVPGQRRVTVLTYLATVLLGSETLLPGQRQTTFLHRPDGMRYEGTPHPNSSVTIDVRGRQIDVALEGPLARAGHHIPTEMERPFIVDEELTYSMQALVRRLYGDRIPKEPEDEPRSIDAIVPSLRAVRTFRARALGVERLQLGSAGEVETCRIQIDIDDPRQVRHDLWVDTSGVVVRARRAWGNGAHQAVVEHQAAYPGGGGAVIDLPPAPYRFRPGRGAVRRSFVWVYPDRREERRIVNRLLFELVPAAATVYPVAIRAGDGGSSVVGALAAAQAHAGDSPPILVLQGRSIALLGALDAPAGGVVLVQPDRGTLNDDGLQALIAAARKSPLLVIGGSEAAATTAVVEQLRPRLPHARFESLPGIDERFQGSREQPVYSSPLPDGFVSLLLDWRPEAVRPPVEAPR